MVLSHLPCLIFLDERHVEMEERRQSTTVFPGDSKLSQKIKKASQISMAKLTNLRQSFSALMGRR